MNPDSSESCPFKGFRKYYAAEKDCQICPLKLRCIYGAGAKRKQLFVPIDSLSNQMVEKIETERGRRFYPQRLAIAEPFSPISGSTSD
jgi:Transposase DDE domain